MGQGLGRNSPVVLTLGKDNYCALIERHGQWIRWRSATKCSCVKLPSMQPDIHCDICSGRGFFYSCQTEQIVFENIMSPSNNSIIPISSDNSNCELIKVYDYDGNVYENAYKLGNFINLNTDKKIKKGVYYTAIFKKNNIKTLKKCIATKDKMGYYTIPGLTVSKGNIDGLYHNAESDIIAIKKITDANGENYTAEEFRLNQFYIKPKIKTEIINDEEVITEIPIAEPLIVEDVEYLEPYTFALLSQNLSKSDTQAVVENQGDAILSFPYECDVANDDVITVLAGTYTQKEVIPRSDNTTDTLGNYFVADIINCTGIINGELFTYQEGRDFVLVGTNKIKWLETAIAYPDVGEAYSITYHVNPTYKVVKEIPQIRTAENQRFPKKAVVKLFTTYSENLGVNKQVVGRDSIKASDL